MRRYPCIGLALVISAMMVFGAGCPSLPSGGGGGGGGGGDGGGDISGGQTAPGGGVPATTQPAVEAGPAYSTGLVDPLYESTAGAKAVVVGDIDNDGTNDLASISNESQPVQIHLRNTTTDVFDTYIIGGGSPITVTNDIELADINSDGKLDVVVLINDTGYAPPPGISKIGGLVVLLQGADPRDQYAWTRVIIDLTENDDVGLTDMTVADFDGVGGPDIVILSNEKAETAGDPDSFVYLYVNPGAALAGNPASWVQAVLELDIADYTNIQTADIDDDTDPDVVIGAPSASSYSARWLENPLAASGSAAAAAGSWDTRIVGHQEGGVDELAVGDIDDDGDLDVAVAHKTLKLVQWFRNPGPTALGREVFPIPWEVFNVGHLASGEINQLQLVDLDSDGVLKCFLTASGKAWVFKPQDNIEDYWTLMSMFTTNPVAEIGQICFDDFDGDGQLDFVTPLDRDGLTNDQFLSFIRN